VVYSTGSNCITKLGGFLLLLWENKECRTSITPITARAPPADTGNQTEQHIQPIGTKKYEQGKHKTDPNWPERGQRHWSSASDKTIYLSVIKESGKCLE
jgi:hypothetical protein